MVQRTESEFTLDTAAELARAEPEAIRGRSPWYLAWRRLRRNYFAFFSLGQAAIQTVGTKGWDGFAVAIVKEPAQS